MALCEACTHLANTIFHHPTTPIRRPDKVWYSDERTIVTSLQKNAPDRVIKHQGFGNIMMNMHMHTCLLCGLLARMFLKHTHGWPLQDVRDLLEQLCGKDVYAAASSEGEPTSVSGHSPYALRLTGVEFTLEPEALNNNLAHGKIIFDPETRNALIEVTNIPYVRLRCLAYAGSTAQLSGDVEYSLPDCYLATQLLAPSPSVIKVEQREAGA